MVQKQSALRRRSFPCQLAAQKIVNCTSNLLSMCLQSEMPGVEETHFGLRVVALECFGAWRQKERIILSPDCEQWWPPCAEIFLELGIENDVAGVIQEEVELNFVVARPGS